jgi:hypothetical protein
MMMRKNLLCLVFALAASGVAASATAGELSVKIANGRATIIAKDVPVRQILAEWAKVGDTKILHGEKVPGGPVTLELIDVPEKEALDVLLRTAAGYITAPRPANIAGASQFDRVIVLATSRAPAATTSLTPPPFGNRMGTQVPPQPPPDDDDGDPGDQGPNAPPAMGPNGPVPNFPPNMPVVGPNGQVLGPGGVINGPNGPVTIGPNGLPIGPNGQPLGPNGMPMNTQPTTTSRPGQLPQQPQVPNPYGTQARPGPMPVRPGGGEGGPDR